MNRLIAALLITWSCLGHVTAGAVADSTARFTLSIAPSGALSYTGLNGYLALQLRHRRHELYAGPKVSFSKSYLPGNNVWGYNAGYQLSMLRSRHLEALANIDFQQIFYRPYSLRHSPSGNWNTVSEYLAGLALRYRPWPTVPFSLQLNLAEGLYRDRFHSATLGESAVAYGISSMLRIGLVYKLLGR